MKKALKIAAIVAAVVAACVAIYFCVTKLIAAKKKDSDSAEENYVSCSCADGEFVSETVA
ncbi:MAG: hypothetical protein IJM45_01330 [Clostridia bacterium]|nr:hypothetical protein [Clostridia bacterium]MBQ9879053.1 hypothetical protein [Clostridia bacterium]MCR5689667.1 hypothetical protein [Clostridiales bacterium]